MTTNTEFSNVAEDLKWRGALFDATPGAEHTLATEKITAYNGFDPTASSLHIGNLVAIMGLVRLQQYGHTPVALVGGGTGMIGDPSGRADERTLLSVADIDYNVEAIRAQLEPFLDFEAKSNPAKVVNNADWLRTTDLLTFLRDVGKHFTVNTMMSRDSVKDRFSRDSGISFTEFSYQLLQAYDFLKLYETDNVGFQAGGSDQWGNILGGVDLIRRIHGADSEGRPRAHGMAYPLVVNSNGEKFGKSIGGAPTLDPKQTSPYKLYQFFLNVADADAVPYVKLFTMLNQVQIGGLAEAVAEEPFKRAAQKALAEDVTRRIHGQSGLDQALKVTQAFFGGDLSNLSADQMEDVLDGSSVTEVTKDQLSGEGLKFSELAVSAGAGKSGGDVKRTIDQGGMYLNGEQISDADRTVGIEDLVEGRLLVIRRGRKNYSLVKLAE
ncbi:tyrosine--tRNA ligase [Candidatus Lucifugimonas marina]|uniref:Tyrosine--tRNA ligase n=1 Tax=Candidatus Lucifugimonas marina TaxID=3038979 RepID=A0AAJ5ZFM8_9CHLR|nr:tyrosine--tRNA ligase [SAR202 cluster bacterium JH702]MDG0869805.1 tyrosine--tRNA ligase [SAR202 cluster bacterium JH639]WFG34532.1 tyrosine--tRNA ligase [SAR202 cluster bacterium JH545]WFG38460.1 tyrosine--tRNA ligase [SAR202 cluster bacterium JH1073]